LRGTEAPFPVTLVTLDPTKKPGDPASILSQRSMHQPDARDHTVTNSRDGLQGVWLAIAAGQPALGGRLAALLWDPLDARWLHSTSEICTPNDQHLAYAVQKLFSGDTAEVQPHLAQIRPRPAEEEPLQFQTKMVRALGEGDSATFLSELGAYVDWHSQKAREPKNKHEWNYYLCLGALGLAGYAVWRRVIDPGQLPANNVYFPLDLLPSSLGEPAR
jgi:hypothetical protein